jgi:hypothetical protein
LAGRFTLRHLRWFTTGITARIGAIIAVMTGMIDMIDMTVTIGGIKGVTM